MTENKMAIKKKLLKLEKNILKNKNKKFLGFFLFFLINY
jgi:hypothetical protein